MAKSNGTYMRATFDDFKQKLAAGGYKTQSAAGAAISRMLISEKEKSEGRKMMMAYFDSKSKPTSSKKVSKPVANTDTLVLFHSLVTGENAKEILAALEHFEQQGFKLEDLNKAIRKFVA